MASRVVWRPHSRRLGWAVSPVVDVSFGSALCMASPRGSPAGRSWLGSSRFCASLLACRAPPPPPSPPSPSAAALCVDSVLWEDVAIRADSEWGLRWGNLLSSGQRVLVLIVRMFPRGCWIKRAEKKEKVDIFFSGGLRDVRRLDGQACLSARVLLSRYRDYSVIPDGDVGMSRTAGRAAPYFSHGWSTAAHVTLLSGIHPSLFVFRFKRLIAAFRRPTNIDFYKVAARLDPMELSHVMLIV